MRTALDRLFAAIQHELPRDGDSLRGERRIPIGQTGATSRRALLRAFALSPVALLPVAALGTPSEQSPALADGVPMLQRSSDGRRLSRFRYHNAESFFVAIEQGVICDLQDQLYQTGIVFQLGLSAHLLDVGFVDDWCARNIGLYVERSLAYSNATGLGLTSADMELLAATLSPYSRYRDVPPAVLHADFPFTSADIVTLTRALLNRVRESTGHPRPRACTGSRRE